MEFPDLLQTQKKLTDIFCYEEEISSDDVKVIASPYRICPLGAHIDHQGGPVLGMTINACTLMAFHPSDDSFIKLRSKNYPGKVKFDLRNIPESTGSFWGIYPRAAALALQEKYVIARGVVGLLDGMLPGCGLSSSASVLLAYLHAFAAANSIELNPWDFVHLTRRAENKYIGLHNGILDQASIVFGRCGHMLHIDTKREKVTQLPDRLGERHYRVLVAYSGYSRELTTSGYNTRVDECRSAALQLSRMAASPPAQVLSDVDQDVFFRYGHRLEPHIGRRAKHFFNETQRVHAGLAAWDKGLIEEFGRLMSESCKSSIEQYECGVQAIYDLQQIVNAADGVLGSRFMGGGFGGCVVGFVKSSHAPVVVADIQASYRKLHPEVAAQAAVYLAQSDDGVRFL
ncbi:MAG: galactokinase family protein [Desulfobacterales bacterium]